MTGRPEGRLGIEVVAPGPLTTVQDGGRPGLAEFGIGTSGAADRRSYALANTLLGNAPGAAALEVTFGGLVVQARGDLLLAVTGAPCAMRTEPAPHGVPDVPMILADGQRLVLGRPRAGLRTYLAVRGGFDVEPVLGSRSTDLLAGIGPPRLHAGSYLRVGDEIFGDPVTEITDVPEPPTGIVELSVLPGPRDDWFAPEALRTLSAQPYQVSPESNRIGMRLLGAALVRTRRTELPSEGLVPGSLQVPPDGRPTLLLADHPVSGGYPVIAVVRRADVARAAQARPGQLLRFHVTHPNAAPGRRI